MAKKKINPIETYVNEVVTKAFESRDAKLKNDDVKEIIKTLLKEFVPEIEEIVSKVVLKHFHALLTYVKINLKDPEEK